ncbi:MAG: hypothetical protein ACXWC4_07610 [Telluria sp.]
MQRQHVVPVLRSIAQVRNWVVANVPLTDTLLGYDLFLKLGNDVLAGLPLDTATIVAGLPYPAQQVTDHLQHMVAAGLVELAAEDSAIVVRPTAHFLRLLDTYGQMFERLFIVRSHLRGKQLAVSASDQQLAEFAQLVYDRVYDMGWLYLHNFGSVCFLMASLVRRIAAAHGYDARVASCWVEITGPGIRYSLGAPGGAKQGQIDGHAAVVLNDRVILDFGLGNVRKGYRRDFAWGAVLDYRREGHMLGSLQTSRKEVVTWKDDWQSPATESELTRYAPFVEELYLQYAQRFPDR